MGDWNHELRERLARFNLPPADELRIIEELSRHLDDRVAELQAEGLTLKEARHSALEEVSDEELSQGGWQRMRVRQADVAPEPRSRGLGVATLWRDLRYTTRTLRRTPGFTATVIIALALTIGPTTAMLSIGNWLLWRPTPGVAQSNRLAVIWVGEWTETGGVSPRGLSYLNLRDLRAWANTVTGIAGEQEGSASVAIPGQPPEFRDVAWVTSDYFAVLDVRIEAGRGLLPADDQPPHGARVVVIGNALARRAFGSPEAAIGEALLLNGLPMSIVGVVAPTFTGVSPFSDVEVWYPGSAYPYVNRFTEEHLNLYASRGDGIFYSFVARLAPGRTFEQAQAELDVLVARLAEEHPAENEALTTARARAFPGLGPMPLMRSGMHRVVTGLLIVGGLLLLLGCVNVATLLLVRGMQRQRDRAVRLSLGATRGRLVQLQLVESCLLAVGGAVAGVFLAVWLKQIIFSLMYPETIASTVVPLDGRVLSATLGVALVCGVLAGLAPAWVGSSWRLARTLARLDTRTTPAGAWLRTTFAATQLALSLVLLTGALLMVQTVRDLRGLDIGLDPAGVYVHYLPLASHGYTEEAALSYHSQVLDALTRAHGLEAVSLSKGRPFGSATWMRVRRPGSSVEPIRVYSNEVTPDYFRLLRIPILRGRGFSADEAMGAASVGGALPVIVSESLGRRLYGGEDPLGQRLEAPVSLPGRDAVVVGVTRDAQWSGLIEEPEPTLYVPFRHGTGGGTVRAVLMVRSSQPVDSVRRSIQAATTAIDPSMPALYLGPLSAHIDGDGDISDRRVFAWALSILGAIGVVLAGFGVAGLLGQIASERTREFGIRLAIGARPRQLYALLLRRAAWIAGTGTIVGLALAWFASRLLENQLYGVSRFDFPTYAAAAGVLALFVLLASMWPGWTAARVDAIEALRAD